MGRFKTGWRITDTEVGVSSTKKELWNTMEQKTASLSWEALTVPGRRAWALVAVKQGGFSDTEAWSSGKRSAGPSEKHEPCSPPARNICRSLPRQMVLKHRDISPTAVLQVSEAPLPYLHAS